MDKPQPKAKRFSPPTVAEVESYCQERKNSIDANKFVDYYTSNGWMVGRNKMKDWKSAVRTWEKRNFNDNSQKSDVFVDTYDYPRLKEGLI